MTKVNSFKSYSEDKRNKRKMASRGRKIEKLNKVVENLMNYSTEGLSNLHPITKGKYAGNMDGHIEGDWVLLYHYSGDKLVLTLTDTGDHQMLFEEIFDDDDLLFHFDDNPPATIEELFDLDYLYPPSLFNACSFRDKIQKEYNLSLIFC